PRHQRVSPGPTRWLMLSARPRFIRSIDSSPTRKERRSPPSASSARNAWRSASVMKAVRRQYFMMLPWKACGSEQKKVAISAGSGPGDPLSVLLHDERHDGDLRDPGLGIRAGPRLGEAVEVRRPRPELVGPAG